MDYSRQSELFDVEAFNRKDIPIHIIGCGATGSWVATIACKMGFKNIHLYDDDIVEIHNLPNQNFLVSDIGDPKARALATTITEYTGEIAFPHIEKVTALNVPKEGYVFVLTDTVKSRKEIFAALSVQPEIKGIIETRMSLDTIQIYTVKNDLEAYAAYRLTMASPTFTDEQVVTSACGTSQTVATTAVVTAGFAVRQLVNFVNGEEVFPEVHISMDNFMLLAI